MMFIFIFVLFLIPIQLFRFIGSSQYCAVTRLMKIQDTLDIICLVDSGRRFFTGYFRSVIDGEIVSGSILSNLTEPKYLLFYIKSCLIKFCNLTSRKCI